MSRIRIAAMGCATLVLCFDKLASAATCRVTYWGWKDSVGNFERIESKTTCRDGFLDIRQYWSWKGERRSAGTATAIIRNYKFTAQFNTMHSLPRSGKGHAPMSLSYDYRPAGKPATRTPAAPGHEYWGAFVAARVRRIRTQLELSITRQGSACSG